MVFQRKLGIICLCIWACWHVLPANAADNQTVMEQAVVAYQKQDFQAAFSLIKSLAQQGNWVAQHNLAVLYQDGLGVQQNAQQALYWYEQAGKQGDAEAQFMAGLMYCGDMGVAQDYAKAVYWYTLAAQQGHSEAQNQGNRTAQAMLQQLQRIQP